MDFKIYTPAFGYGRRIPDIYTCKGINTPPPFRWENAPGETVSFALVVENHDVPKGAFIHWIVYNIPSYYKNIDKNLKNGAIHCKNDFGKYRYDGPFPIRGKTQRYFFTLLALSKRIRPGLIKNRDLFFEAIKDNIINKVSYMGIY